MQAFSTESEMFISKKLGEYKVGSLKELPPHIRKQVRRDANTIALGHVFGVDHKKDKDGQPIEQGIGTPENITKACVDAYITEQTVRRDSPEAGYEEHLKFLRERLEVCEARRRAARRAEDDDDDDE